jgi:hypothetical protein
MPPHGHQTVAVDRDAIRLVARTAARAETRWCAGVVAWLREHRKMKRELQRGL